MAPADLAFQKILAAIRPLLLTQGFVEGEAVHHPEAFGSRYTTFRGLEEVIRLTWDGKERWFVLETIPIELSSSVAGWADILLHYFRTPEDTLTVADEIVEDMAAALRLHLGLQTPG